MPWLTCNKKIPDLGKSRCKSCSGIRLRRQKIFFGTLEFQNRRRAGKRKLQSAVRNRWKHKELGREQKVQYVSGTGKFALPPQCAAGILPVESGGLFQGIGDGDKIRLYFLNPFSKEQPMLRSILASILLALFAVHTAAGEEDLETQIKALQKERLETLSRLVKIYSLQYTAAIVSGETFAETETALADAQLDAALVNVQLDPNRKLPDAIANIFVNVAAKALEAVKTVNQRNTGYFAETFTDWGLWDLPSLHLHLRLARAEKDEADIKKMHDGLIAKLTELVENYKHRYKTGTAPLEALIKARAKLLDARLDAAEKPEERVALLEEHEKSEAELFKVADIRRKATACSARSLVLAAKIKMLREQSAKDDVAAQLKAAQKERVEALAELVKIDKELYDTKWTNFATLTQAKADLANARADAAETSEAKILVLTEAAKEQAEFIQFTEKRAQVGFQDTDADVDRERLHLLDFKIRILRERGLQKTHGQ